MSFLPPLSNKGLHRPSMMSAIPNNNYSLQLPSVGSVRPRDWHTPVTETTPKVGEPTFFPRLQYQQHPHKALTFDNRLSEKQVINVLTSYIGRKVNPTKSLHKVVEVYTSRLEYPELDDVVKGIFEAAVRSLANMGADIDGALQAMGRYIGRSPEAETVAANYVYEILERNKIRQEKLQEKYRVDQEFDKVFGTNFVGGRNRSKRKLRKSTYRKRRTSKRRTRKIRRSKH